MLSPLVRTRLVGRLAAGWLLVEGGRTQFSIDFTFATPANSPTHLNLRTWLQKMMFLGEGKKAPFNTVETTFQLCCKSVYSAVRAYQSSICPLQSDWISKTRFSNKYIFSK